MSEEQKAANRGRVTGYILNIAQKFTQEIGVAREHDPTLIPLEDHELPREFLAEQPITTLGPLIKLTDRLLAVDETLKNLIERIEPGKHLFWPIKIKNSNGVPYPEP